ncbi:MAG: shikimate kinase [Candidatus Omnitrophica bacterium]|nr:shikimate kinase [Candidatus Omnitrophota bacterium]
MPSKSPHLPDNIVLIGFMGSGKTTFGKKLAAELGWSFIDADQQIVKRKKQSVDQIFRNKGEKYFRSIESSMVDELTQMKSTVIALGGGAVKSPGVRRTIRKKKSYVIWLQVSAEQVRRRTSGSSARPLLNTENPMKVIRCLLRERKPLYRQCADIAVNSKFLIDATSLTNRVRVLRQILKSRCRTNG